MLPVPARTPGMLAAPARTPRMLAAPARSPAGAPCLRSPGDAGSPCPAGRGGRAPRLSPGSARGSGDRGGPRGDPAREGLRAQREAKPGPAGPVPTETSATAPDI